MFGLHTSDFVLFNEHWFVSLFLQSTVDDQAKLYFVVLRLDLVMMA